MASTTVAGAQGFSMSKPAPSPWLIAVSVMLATFMEVLDTSIASVALPYIAGSLSATNDEAVSEGLRILSAYAIDPAKPAKGYGENCLWIITEADRSATTFLLPSEY